MVTKRVAYQCDYCYKVFYSRDECEWHEKNCYKNPENQDNTAWVRGPENYNPPNLVKGFSSCSCKEKN